MPLDPISEYAPGELITAAWANTLRRNQDALNSRTGGDPAMAGMFLAASSGTTGAWRFLQSADFTSGLIPDSALAHAQVWRANQQNGFATFAAALGIGSGFYDVGASADSPNPARPNWLAMQSRHWNWGAGDYRWILACDLYDPNELYFRSIAGAAIGPWVKVFHAGNSDPLMKAGGQMTGSISFRDTLEGIVLAGGTQFRDDVATGLAQLLANGDRLGVYNEAQTIIMLDLRPTVAIFAGQVQAPSVIATGNVVSNTGIVQGTQLISTVALGTPPAQAASSTLIPNWNADMVDNCHVGTGLGQIPVNNNTLNTNLNAGLLGGLTKDQIIAQAAGGGVPSGVVALWKTATPPTTWVIDTDFQGRFPIGADPSWPTLNSVAGTANHQHNWDSRHVHGATGLGIGGTLGGPSGQNTAGGTGHQDADASHIHSLAAVDVTGGTDSAGQASQTVGFTDHYPPFRAVHYIRKQ